MNKVHDCQYKQLSAGLLAVILSMWSSVPLLADEYLRGEELRRTLSGNTIEGLRGNWRVYYDPNGEIRGLEGGYTDKGTWEVQADHYCARWSNWVGGKKMCWKVTRTGNRLQREGMSGAPSGEVKLLQGNAGNL